METCGILCGVLRDGEAGESLLITHLVVPKQKGGPDSCETLNEQDLFEFQVPHVNIHVLLLAMAVCPYCFESRKCDPKHSGQPLLILSSDRNIH